MCLCERETERETMREREEKDTEKGRERGGGTDSDVSTWLDEKNLY